MNLTHTGTNRENIEDRSNMPEKIKNHSEKTAEQKINNTAFHKDYLKMQGVEIIGRE